MDELKSALVNMAGHFSFSLGSSKKMALGNYPEKELFVYYSLFYDGALGWP